MAKAIVKCLYCGQNFDRNDPNIPFVKVNSNRYAHKTCADQRDQLQTKEDKDKEAFFKYCSQKFGKQFDFVRTKRMADSYIKKYSYTWSGMLKCLVYFFDIKKNPIEKANGGIGIIPYIYQEAHDYYYDIWQAQQLNADKKIENYVPEVIEIKIPPPEPRPKKRRLFTFLDREEK